jgi:hypothetical protein
MMYVSRWIIQVFGLIYGRHLGKLSNPFMTNLENFEQEKLCSLSRELLFIYLEYDYKFSFYKIANLPYIYFSNN